MIRKLTASFVFLLVSMCVMAQDYTIVERSGEKCYSHHVEAGHTLYAIAVLYDSEEEIIRTYNDQLLKEGLKVGQTIYIPVNPDFKAGQIYNPIRIEDGFLVHRVLKKETLFSICKKYIVDINDVLELNPEANSGIKKGQELKIPVNDVNAAVSVAPPVNFNLTEWKTHTVLPGETLYGISKKYDLKIKDILEVNEGLPEGLKSDQVINLPIKSEKDNNPIVQQTTMKEVMNSWERGKRKHAFKDKYDVALALPLYLSESNSENLSMKERRIQRVGLNFYRGAHLAALKLQEEGLSMNMHVLNITNNKSQTKLLASDQKLHSMDLFIGPFQKAPLSKIIEIADGSGAHVVCPTRQSGKLLLSHPNVSKVTPSQSTMMAEVAEYIAAQKHNPNVILITTKWVKDKRNIDAFEKSYYRALADSSLMKTRRLKIIAVDDLSASTLKSKLSSTQKNIVVMPTDEKISLGKLVNVLPFIRAESDMCIFLTDKWMDSSYIDANTRNKFNIHIPTYFSGDYNSKKVSDFSKLYNSEYDDVIDEYAILGYDVMLFYGRGLKEHGLDFTYHFDSISRDGILDYQFNFEAVGPDSGFENHGTHIMFFEDYKLKPIE